MFGNKCRPAEPRPSTMSRWGPGCLERKTRHLVERKARGDDPLLTRGGTLVVGGVYSWDERRLGLEGPLDSEKWNRYLWKRVLEVDFEFFFRESVRFSGLIFNLKYLPTGLSDTTGENLNLGVFNDFGYQNIHYTICKCHLI